MTLRDLILLADRNSVPMLAVLAALPAASFVVGRLHKPGEGREAPWRGLYALLVYAASIPGTFSASLILYTMLFTSENLLDASLTVYFGPLASMVLTLWIVRRAVSFDDVPGFDRIGGLLGVLATSFTLALVAQKTRLLVIFGGSLWMLASLALLLFLFLRFSARRMLGPGHPGRP